MLCSINGAVYQTGIGRVRYEDCLVCSVDSLMVLHFFTGELGSTFPCSSQVHPFCIPAVFTRVYPYHLTLDSCKGMSSQ